MGHTGTKAAGDSRPGKYEAEATGQGGGGKGVKGGRVWARKEGGVVSVNCFKKKLGGGVIQREENNSR